MKEEREVTQEELAELIQAQKGEFIIHIEQGTGDDNGKEEPS